MSDLKGKIAVITGAGTGIGRSICRRLAKDGATLVVTDLNENTALATLADIQASSPESVAYRMD
ncbi:MAG: SDR family NAD(P)-dependent oxidoreductase, partial [Spirochaetota bacterium]